MFLADIVQVRKHNVSQRRRMMTERRP